MQKNRWYVLILLISFILNACGSNGSKGTPADMAGSSFSLSEKIYVHDLFLSEYLWNDQVSKEIEYENYNTAQSLVNALRVTPPDRWSFTLTRSQYDNMANQKTSGFGFAYGEDFTIALVRIGSPSDGTLMRGDKIIKVDSREVTRELIAESAKKLNTSVTFQLERAGKMISVNVTPREYQFKVSMGKVIDQNMSKIGYLRLDAFTETAVEEFEKIFDTFHNENIDELVIDLRYNGGGAVATTSALLDNIIADQPEQLQMVLDWNAEFKQKNTQYTFESLDMQDGNELTMHRVFFLVTKDSASASEALINALVPYLGEENVVVIGENTHGKPVGMSGRVYGNNIYFLINFFVNNRLGDTTSFEGIPVDCQAPDDLSHKLGDENEAMLKAALDYVGTNGKSCVMP